MPIMQAGGEGGGGGMPSPNDYIQSLPIVTRYWLGTTLVLTLIVNFGVVPAYHVLWSWTHVKESFELWRFLTAFCYAGPFAFGTLISIVTLAQFSNMYEAQGPFNTGAGGGTADYVFCLLIGAGLIFVTWPVLRMYFDLPPMFCRNLTYYVLYLWSKRFPTSQASIWGFPVQAKFLPFVHLAFLVFTGSPFHDVLHGMAMAHIYYFMVDVVPMAYGKDIIRTPQFLIEYFGVGEYRPETGLRAAPQENNNDGVHRWGGGGQTLGGSGGATGGGFSGGTPRGGAAAAPRTGGGHDWGGGGRSLGRN